MRNAGSNHKPKYLFRSPSRTVIMLELTMLWGEHREEANERKMNKYQELVEECRNHGWLDAVDVGCRDFLGHSHCKGLAALGVTGAAKKEEPYVSLH